MKYYPNTLKKSYISGIRSILKRITNKGDILVKKIIVSPNKDYDATIKLNNEIIAKLKKNGYTFDASIDIDKLLETNIRVCFFIKSENIQVDGKIVEKLLNVVTLSSIDNKILTEFLYIVNNFRMYQNISAPKFKLYHYRYSKQADTFSCRNYTVNVKKTFENVFLSLENYSLIKDNIDTWLASKKLYKRRGIAHKIGFLFQGAPGCGKTSVIYAIAEYTRKHVYSLDLTLMTNNELYSIGQSVSDAILLIDDADAYKILHKRKSENLQLIATESTNTTIEEQFMIMKAEDLKKNNEKYDEKINIRYCIKFVRW